MRNDVIISVFRECFYGEPNGAGAFLSPSSPGIFALMESLTAEEASMPSAGASIATHAKHLAHCMNIFISAAEQGRHPGEMDWNGDWDENSVTESEWKALQEIIREQIPRFDAAVARRHGDREDYSILGGLAHTAYHLGAIQVKYDVLRQG